MDKLKNEHSRRFSLKHLFALACLLLVLACGLAFVPVILNANPTGAHGRLVATDIDGRRFIHGDTFDMTISIEGNTGFTTMPIRITVPAGLEITHIRAGIHGIQDMAATMPPGHMPVTGAINPITGPGRALVSYHGQELNFTAPNADLFTFTFRVTENAALGETQPITFAIAYANAYARIVNSDGLTRDILLPGRLLPGGMTRAIGSVIIDKGPTSVSIRPETPGQFTIENAIGASANFIVEAEGMPPGETFCLAYPECRAYSNCPSYSGIGQTASMAIEIYASGAEIFPAVIETSGHITILETGRGTGILTLTIADIIGICRCFYFEFAGVLFYSECD